MARIHFNDNEIKSEGVTILNGRVLRDQGVDRLKTAIVQSGRKPTLAIIQVGDLAESKAYIEQKRKFAEKIGAGFFHTQFPNDVSQADLENAIEKLNVDPGIHGIIVQLPIPESFNKQKVIDTISVSKDTDGLTSENKKLLESGNSKAVIPATARGVLSLLRGYDVSVSGKKVTVIGRSALVGAPIATLLAREGAEVTVCHRETNNVPEKSRNAEILIVAVGHPHFVTVEYVSKGQVVVDVGINSVASSTFKQESVEKLEYEIPKRQLVGDVDFEAVKNIVAAISPVPGGVGPMTVLSLFENLIEAAAVDNR
ncbi:MAG: bifunctional 5,10-methylenetetrahydrofolate dehydrogenase/5,10-methenyltetrahydrofolate cyclohydrolase [Patescibacteria group bacterium]